MRRIRVSRLIYNYILLYIKDFTFSPYKSSNKVVSNEYNQSKLIRTKRSILSNIDIDNDLIKICNNKNMNMYKDEINNRNGRGIKQKIDSLGNKLDKIFKK